MGKYIRRAIKYFIYLVVLFILIYVVMSLTGMTQQMNSPELLWSFVRSKNGLFMIVAIVVLAVLYPKSGFVKREVKLNMEDQKERNILFSVFDTSGFHLIRENAGELVFRARSPFKRLALLYEDDIVVTKDTRSIVLEGSRRSVVHISFRLDSFLLNKDKE